MSPNSSLRNTAVTYFVEQLPRTIVRPGPFQQHRHAACRRDAQSCFPGLQNTSKTALVFRWWHLLLVSLWSDGSLTRVGSATECSPAGRSTVREVLSIVFYSAYSAWIAHEQLIPQEISWTNPCMIFMGFGISHGLIIIEWIVKVATACGRLESLNAQLWLSLLTSSNCECVMQISLVYEQPTSDQLRNNFHPIFWTVIYTLQYYSMRRSQDFSSKSIN